MGLAWYCYPMRYSTIHHSQYAVRFIPEEWQAFPTAQQVRQAITSKRYSNNALFYGVSRTGSLRERQLPNNLPLPNNWRRSNPCLPSIHYIFSGRPNVEINYHTEKWVLAAWTYYLSLSCGRMAEDLTKYGASRLTSVVWWMIPVVRVPASLKWA